MAFKTIHTQHGLIAMARAESSGSPINLTAIAVGDGNGTLFGEGDGFTTFNLPDMRGEFLRGWDDARGVDGGRKFGSGQLGSIQSHSHTGSSADAGSHAHTGSAQSGGVHSHSAISGAAGGHAHSYGGGQSFTYSGSFAGDTINSNARHYTMQTDAVGDHQHAISVGNGGAHGHDLSINSAGTHKHGVTIEATGGAETRPRNVALLACIKF